jgi:phosphoglycolate phosphatase
MTTPLTPVSPTVVFDLDGTIADTAPDLVATLNVILAEERVPTVTYEQARDMIGAGARALIERGLIAADITPSAHELDHLFTRFIAHYGDNLCNKTRLFPGLVEALDELAGMGYRFAVCTNKIESHSIKLIEQLGLADRFATVCGRDTFPWFKPDPRHLTMTVEQAGGDPTRALLVGDSRTDIDTARNASLPSIGVPFGYTETPMVDLKPDRLIAHYDQLVTAVTDLLPIRAG